MKKVIKLTQSGTVVAEWGIRYIIPNNITVSFVLPKIRPWYANEFIDLVLLNPGQQAPAITLADGDGWAVDPGGSTEQWGINTCDWLRLDADVEANEWHQMLTQVGNQSGS